MDLKPINKPTQWQYDWMKIALGFAENALKNNEVPVGCIFVYDNEIIANGANTVNETKNATRHAEMNCIDTVLSWCKERNLNFTEVFKAVDVVVTVEPCIMCSAALFELKVKRITYGCKNYRFGGCSTVFDISKIYRNSNCVMVGGVYDEESINLLKDFYKGSNPNVPLSKAKKKSLKIY